MPDPASAAGVPQYYACDSAAPLTVDCVGQLWQPTSLTVRCKLVSDNFQQQQQLQLDAGFTYGCGPNDNAGSHCFEVTHGCSVQQPGKAGRGGLAAWHSLAQVMFLATLCPAASPGWPIPHVLQVHANVHVNGSESISSSIMHHDGILCWYCTSYAGTAPLHCLHSAWSSVGIAFLGGVAAD